MTARLGSVSSNLVRVKRPLIFYIDLGHVAAKIGTELESETFVLETRRHLLSGNLLRGRCGACGKIGGCSGDDGFCGKRS